MQGEPTMSDKTQTGPRPRYLSPLMLSILAANAVCFGACVVMLILSRGSGPLALLTIGTGLSFAAGLTGAIVTSCQIKNQEIHREEQVHE